jgi:VCBS repeat-containing protein
VLFNDSDPDGNPLLAFVDSQPQHGVAFVNLDGSFGYTPDPDFSGQDSFYYIAYDGLAYSPPQTVTVNVLPVNDGPQAVADAYTADEDVLLQVDAVNGLLANDLDVDGDPLTAILAGGPLHGDLTLNPDGSFSYLPDAEYSGGDSFTYYVSDGLLQSGTVTVSLTVNPVNDPPQADDLVVSIWVDQTLTGRLTASDVDSTSLTFALAGAPGHGSLEIEPDGDFTYTPEPGYQGEDSFTFTVSDGAGGEDTGLVTISIAILNQVWLPLIMR